MCTLVWAEVWSQSHGPKNPGSELKAEELKTRRNRFNKWFKEMVETKVSGLVSELEQVDVDVEMEDYASLMGDVNQPYFLEDVDEVEKSASASSSLVAV